MTLTYTQRFHLAIPDFLSEPWHSDFATAMISIDQALYSAIVAANSEVWTNSHVYSIGNLVIDSTTGSLFSCAFAHTSAAFPTTFAQDRVAHPTFWTAFVVAIATQAEAEAGVENAKYMTPLRVSQAIDVQAPVVGALGFAAHKNGTNQTGVLHATFTKVTFPTEVYDLGNKYDPAQSRWTPQAGLVSISAGLFVTTGLLVPGHLGILIYKNGIAFKQTHVQTQTFEGAVVISADDQANGTDFYEIWTVGPASAGGYLVTGDPTYTYFMGHVVQSVIV